MKIQKFLKHIFVAVASVCVVMGFGCIHPTETKADDVAFTDVDITNKLAINRVVDTTGKNYIDFYVNAGETVGAYVKGLNTNPTVYAGLGRRWVLNGSSLEDVSSAGCDLLSYIEINDVSVRDILSESGSTYGTFDRGDSAFDAYTPVMVNAEGLFLDGFHVMISKDYIMDINEESLDGWTLTFNSGIVWNNVLEHSLKTTKDVTWEYTNGFFDKEFAGEQPNYTDVDITNKLAINRVVDTTGKNYIDFYVNAGETVGAYVKGLNTNPTVYAGLGRRWVLNGSSLEDVFSAGCDLLSYIEINDVSVRDILSESGSTYGTFDRGDSAFDAYTPVMVNAEGLFLDGFHIMISKAYIRDVNNGELDNWTLTVNSGIVWNNVLEHSLKTTKDVTFTYYKGAFLTEKDAEKIKPTLDKDVTETTTVSLTKKNMENRAELILNFGADVENILPIFDFAQVIKDKGFYVNDHATDYGTDVDFMEYVLLNGRTLRSIIMENYDTREYVGTSYPMTFGGWFAPIAVRVGEKQVSIDIFNQYCAWQDIRITLKSGFTWTVKGTETHNYLLKWTEDVTYGIKDGALVRFDGGEKVNLDRGMQVSSAASVGEYKHYTIYLKETFNNAVADVTETWKDVVTVNGVTMGELNASEAGTIKAELGFTYGKTTIEVFIKNSYASVTPVSDIGLKPFEVEFVSVNCVLEKEVEFRYSEGVFKRVCLITFDGGEVIEALEGERLPQEKVPANPTKASTAEKTYVFKGWYYQYTDGLEYVFETDKFVVLSNMDLRSKFAEENKKYTVMFLNENGETVAMQEVSCGEEICLQDMPKKEHYTGVWVYQGENEPSVMPAEDICYKAQYTATTYTVTFYKNAVGTEVLAVKTYTVEDKTIEVPEVIQKAGYTASWATYQLNGGDIEVRPVYEGSGGSSNTSKGCGSTLSGIGSVGFIAAFAFVMKRKKEDV